MHCIWALVALTALAGAQAETALVLGSGGLVGQGLVQQLHKHGWDVLEVSNASSGVASVAGMCGALPRPGGEPHPC